MTSVVPAIVLGGDYLGLGIVRSLGRRGVPVTVIDDEHSISRFSRFTTRQVKVAELRDPDRIVDTILDVVARNSLAGGVLYPTRDEMVAAIARRHDELSKVLRITTAPWEVVRWAWDKRNTYALAERLGIPVPRTWYPAGPADLDQVEGGGPWVLKPAIKEHFIYATKAKAWRAGDRAQLRELFAQAAGIVGDGEMMVQELIPGDGRRQLSYCAFVRGGVPVGTMSVGRRRQHPPDFGRASTYVETIEDDRIESASRRVLSEIGFSGLVELEYKVDPRDGQPKLLDVNARAWGYHSVGAAAGVDFAYLAYAEQTGAAVEPCRAAPGVHWIRLLTDTPTALLEIVRGTLGVRAYLRSLVRVRTEAVLSLDDPAPWFAEAAMVPYLAVKRGF